MITITGLRFDGYIIMWVRFWKFGNLFRWLTASRTRRTAPFNFWNWAETRPRMSLQKPHRTSPWVARWTFQSSLLISRAASLRWSWMRFSMGTWQFKPVLLCLLHKLSNRNLSLLSLAMTTRYRNNNSLNKTFSYHIYNDRWTCWRKLKHCP